MSVMRTIAQITLPSLVLVIVFLIYTRYPQRKGRKGAGLVALLCLLVVGNLLSLYPVKIPAINAQLKGNGSFLEGNFKPTVLVIGSRMDGTDFESTDWCYQWANLLEQETGGLSIASPEMIGPEFLENISLVVITGAGAGDKYDISALRTWVEAGGVLIVEFPAGKLLELGGLEKLDDPTWIPNEISGAENDGLERIGDIPLYTNCQSISPVEGTVIKMSMDGEPVVFLREMGKGGVISFAFDVGRELTVLQQGIPDDGFRVVDKRGSEGIVDSTDLLASTEHMVSDIPYADLLERWIISLVEEIRPMPRPWYFPFQHDGVVTMTHDEDWFGDESCFVLEEERKSDYNSTFFIISKGPVTDEGLERMNNLGGDIHIHWNREVHRWLMVFRRGEGSLEDQIEVLEDKLSDPGGVSLCRIERLRWGNHYTRPFRIMEAQSIALDSSLGSAGRTGKGYMYGTGLPFHPLDTNGEPFSLYELPFQIQAQYSGINQIYIDELLENSRNCYHQVINALYHPCDLVEGQPSRRDWLVFDELARKHNHALFTLSEFVLWWKSRGRINVSGLQMDGEGLSFSCESPVNNSAIMLHLSSESGDPSVYVNGETSSRKREVLVHGRRYLLIGLNQGRHEVKIDLRDK